jgi:exodeoxyribonuclease V alpha subunit
MADIETIQGIVTDVGGDRRGDGSFDMVTLDADGASVVCVGDVPRGIGPGMCVDVEGVRSARGQVRLRSIVPAVPGNAEMLVRVIGAEPRPERIAALGRLFAGAESPADACAAIYQDPERVLGEAGIQGAELERVTAVFRDYFRRVMAIDLVAAEAGVESAVACELAMRFDLPKVLAENPYELIRDPQMSFKAVDGVGRAVAVPPDDVRRLAALMVGVLKEDQREGHCFTSKDDVLARFGRRAGVGGDGEAVLDKAVESQLLDVEGDRVYLPGILAAEKAVARRLAEIAARPRDPRWSEAAVDRVLERVCIDPNTGKPLNEQQRRGVGCGLVAPLVQIVGGAGTGKSTLLEATRAGLLALKGPEAGMLVVTPSACAAERVNQILGQPLAQTAQLALGMTPDGRFMRGPDNPLPPYDLIVFEEWSMGDLRLMHNAMRSLSPKSRVMFMGDCGFGGRCGQLPPIDAGKVFTDMLEAGIGEVVELTQAYRSAGNFNIIEGVEAIEKGRMPPLPEGQFKGGVIFLPAPTVDVAAVVSDVMTEGLPALGIKLEDCQIIAPMRVSPTGTTLLNMAMQDVLNPDGMSLERWWSSRDTDRYCVPRVGDPVIQVENVKIENGDSVQRFFNGQAGVLEKFEDERMHVRFRDGRERSYLPHRAARELEVAYAETVHKMQGQEREAVVVVITPDHEPMLQRELLKVAWSRGKRALIVVGSDDAIRVAVENAPTMTRRSTLSERIRQAVEAGRQEWEEPRAVQGFRPMPRRVAASA